MRVACVGVEPEAGEPASKTPARPGVLSVCGLSGGGFYK